MQDSKKWYAVNIHPRNHQVSILADNGRQSKGGVRLCQLRRIP